ncbi:ABC transporter permease [Candidatus Thioglobus sp.]|jgi:ribose/xylose/arabinose/galactoside ABC-type transport system permease subunit|nr:ABC transporter permease [Candidatus Thioglobus sp.]|tara:strand:- start:1371 stop:2324 length:954 start_codon:yes stop_codon:yes gene_type:complete
MKVIGTKITTNTSLFLFLGFLVILFSFTSEHFLSPYNITSLLTNISYSGIAAIVLTLVMISRGLDISIGGVIGLTTVVVSALYSQSDPLPIWLILTIGLGVGAVVGLINGWCITVLDMDPIITTLGAMAITRGLAYVISDSQSILMFEETTDFISNGVIFNVPIPILLFILTALIFSIVLHKSKFGRSIYAIGANEVSASLSGISVNKTKMILYVLTGIAASVSGIILLGQTSVGMPQHGIGAELEVITAVLLGGTALSGGKGTIYGTIAGVLILGVLFNGLTISGVRYVHLQIFQGLLLLVAVATYEIKTRNEVAR